MAETQTGDERKRDRSQAEYENRIENTKVCYQDRKPISREFRLGHPTLLAK